MFNRTLCGYSVLPLAFGTSSFVRGKLSPDADSEKGISALRFALENGVNVVHSADSLGTQWAVRQVVEANKTECKIIHIIKKKIDCPITTDELDEFVKQNLLSLGGGIPFVQIEFSKDDAFDYEQKKEFIRNITCQERYPIFIHLKNEEDADGFIGIDGVSGYTVKYNSENMWITAYLDKIEAMSSDLIVMSPFNRVSPPNNTCVKNIFSDILSHRCIKCIVLSSTDTMHWQENIVAVKQIGGFKE